MLVKEAGVRTSKVGGFTASKEKVMFKLKLGVHDDYICILHQVLAYAS